jgi:hypothetical protein
MRTTPLLPVVHNLRYREQPGRWKFVLTEELRITFPTKLWGRHIFADKDGRVWAETDGRDWILSKDYAWDGASFAINFAETIAASAWHDAAGQFRHLLCIKKDLPRDQWNKLFADIITSQGAPKVAAIYHFGLVIGNPFYNLAGKILGNHSTGQCLIHKKP